MVSTDSAALPIDRDPLYEGKAKIIYPAERADEVLIRFKDEATAFDGTKKDVIAQKGRLNAGISARLMNALKDAGVSTHFIESVDDVTHRARHLEMIPVEVVVRNRAAGSLVKRFGLAEGLSIDPPLVEFYLKDDARHDPMITPDHMRLLGIGDLDLSVELRRLGLVINEVLKRIFDGVGLTLVDFKLEFGRDGEELVLGDEVTPDTCRLWDSKTGEKLDKDRFRFDLGDLVAGYGEIERRLDQVSP